MATGKTWATETELGFHDEAAMEPGRGDREDPKVTDAMTKAYRPQWSPVVVTGKTRGR